MPSPSTQFSSSEPSWQSTKPSHSCAVVGTDEPCASASASAEVGSHVRLYQGVSLIARSLSGGKALRGKKRHPTVEDHVTIYAGATIMGGDTVVGAGTTIGANVFLTHSVPPNSLVLFEEAQLRVVPKRKRDDGNPIEV